MAIVAALTPTPIPANTNIGVMPMVMFHQTITPAGGAGTYTFAHGLALGGQPYAPTAVIVMAQDTQGTTPTKLASVDWNDTTTANIAVNVSGNGVYDVYYG